MRQDERQTARKLVDEALKAGLWLRVDYGGQWASPATRDGDLIMSQLGACDIEHLCIYKVAPTAESDLKSIGSVMLVYGNEPGVLVSDYTVHPEIEAVMKPVDALMDEISRTH